VPLAAFDPPGHLDDFEQIPGQLKQWSDAVSGWFDSNIELIEKSYLKGGQPQYFNETKVDPPGAVVDQLIPWSALPGTLRNTYGRSHALQIADDLVPLTQRIDGPGAYMVGPAWEGLFYRPQDEYCEWHVDRDEQGRIVKVTFTSEPPEYWQALHGDTIVDGNYSSRVYEFTGDRRLLLDLYREYVSPEVRLEDLECADDLVDLTDPRNPLVLYGKGQYNPYNRWNTTGGIMHLTHPANTLQAEVNLGAVATILYQAYDRPVVDPEALILAAAFGGPNRTSDPTIGATVNQLAAAGAYITLRNPVGLAMHHLDLAGFTTPSGEPVSQDFFKVLRGSEVGGLIERAVFAVPAGEGYTVSDLRIGGVPITHGAQIAEHIVVNIVGRAGGLGTFDNERVPPRTSGMQSNVIGDLLSIRTDHDPVESTATPAFDYPGGGGSAAVPADQELHRRRGRLV
jgi:hypothetical protein